MKYNYRHILQVNVEIRDGISGNVRIIFSVG